MTIDFFGTGRSNERKLRLFIVIFVVSALFVIAVGLPRIRETQKALKESEMKSFPIEFKAAASIYYGDHGGLWPRQPSDLIPKYLEGIKPEWHSKSDKVVATYDGTGGWIYNSQTGDLSPNIPTPIPTK